MAHPYWPLFDLLLHTQNLLLRPMSEKDQALLADRLPDGVALDPAAMRLAGVGRRHTRGVILYQGLLERLRLLAAGALAAPLRRVGARRADWRADARGRRLPRRAHRRHLVVPGG